MMMNQLYGLNSTATSPIAGAQLRAGMLPGAPAHHPAAMLGYAAPAQPQRVGNPAAPGGVAVPFQIPHQHQSHPHGQVAIMSTILQGIHSANAGTVMDPQHAAAAAQQQQQQQELQNILLNAQTAQQLSAQMSNATSTAHSIKSTPTLGDGISNNKLYAQTSIPSSTDTYESYTARTNCPLTSMRYGVDGAAAPNSNNRGPQRGGDGTPRGASRNNICVLRGNDRDYSNNYRRTSLSPSVSPAVHSDDGAANSNRYQDIDTAESVSTEASSDHGGITSTTGVDDRGTSLSPSTNNKDGSTTNTTESYPCLCCNIQCFTKANFEQHMQSARHKSRMESMNLALQQTGGGGDVAASSVCPSAAAATAGQRPPHPNMPPHMRPPPPRGGMPPHIGGMPPRPPGPHGMHPGMGRPDYGGPHMGMMGYGMRPPPPGGPHGPPGPPPYGMMDPQAERHSVMEFQRMVDRQLNQTKYCQICARSIKPDTVHGHKADDEHKRKERLTRRGCILCKTGHFLSYPDYVRHIDSDFHKKNKEKLQEDLAKKDDDGKSEGEKDEKKNDKSGENAAGEGAMDPDIEDVKGDMLDALVSNDGAGIYEQACSVKSDVMKRSRSETEADEKKGDDFEPSELVHDPDTPVGQMYVVPISGFFCKLCHKFYSQENNALEMHCQSQEHFDKLRQLLIQKKRQGNAIYLDCLKPLPPKPKPAATTKKPMYSVASTISSRARTTPLTARRPTPTSAGTTTSGGAAGKPPSGPRTTSSVRSAASSLTSASGGSTSSIKATPASNSANKFTVKSRLTSSNGSGSSMTRRTAVLKPSSTKTTSAVMSLNKRIGKKDSAMSKAAATSTQSSDAKQQQQQTTPGKRTAAQRAADSDSGTSKKFKVEEAMEISDAESMAGDDVTEGPRKHVEELAIDEGMHIELETDDVPVPTDGDNLMIDEDVAMKEDEERHNGDQHQQHGDEHGDKEDGEDSEMLQNKENLEQIKEETPAELNIDADEVVVSKDMTTKSADVKPSSIAAKSQPSSCPKTGGAAVAKKVVRKPGGAAAKGKVAAKAAPTRASARPRFK